MSNNNNNTDTTTCGISSPLTTCTEALSNDLTCLHPSHFFSIHHPTNSTHNNNDDVDDYHHHNCITGSGSPVMYSNHAPALSGLTKCEYCGCPNVKLCPGVSEVQLQLREYQRRVMREDGVILPEEDVSSMHSAGVNNTHDTTNTINNTINNNTTMNKCHRPKLFFLKKRPPFASTNDTGWNPTTQHRTLLFEPPSSMEGISRGYGEVRGRLGGFDTVNYTSPKLSVGGSTSGGGGGLLGGSMRSGYRMDRRSLSLPLRHGGSSVGGGGNKGRCDSISGEVEVRSLSASHHHRVASSSGIVSSGSASLVSGGGRRSPVGMMNRQYSRGSTGGTGGSGNSGSKITEEEVEGGRSLSPWNNWFG